MTEVHNRLIISRKDLILCLDHLLDYYATSKGRMLTRDGIIELLQDERDYLAAEFGVSKIGLFGSYATGQPHQASDVDLVVEFDRPIGFRFIELIDYLESVLGRRVDVLTPAGIQNIRIDQVAKSISESVVYV